MRRWGYWMGLNPAQDVFDLLELYFELRQMFSKEEISDFIGYTIAKKLAYKQRLIPLPPAGVFFALVALSPYIGLHTARSQIFDDVQTIYQRAFDTTKHRLLLDKEKVNKPIKMGRFFEMVLDDQNRLVMGSSEPNDNS